MPKQSVAAIIADTLHTVGVRRIYGIVGDSLNGLTDSLQRKRNIDWIHVRHERDAAGTMNDTVLLSRRWPKCPRSGLSVICEAPIHHSIPL